MSNQTKKLSISKIDGTSSHDASTFTLVGNSLAYVAGAGVVVCNITGSNEVTNSRFFCANSGKNVSQMGASSANSYLNMIPGFNSAETVKKTDSFGFNVCDEPEVIYGANSSHGNDAAYSGGNNAGIGIGSSGIDDSSASPLKLANKIRTISCVAVSPDERLLAVGESGYQPRVLIYSLAPESNLKPVVIIAEHQFGINKLKFSPDSRLLASLGFINDGFLNIWSIPLRRLISANKCSSVVNAIHWESSVFMTVGTRHAKVWFVDETDAGEDLGRRITPLKGKNVLLNGFLNSNFIDCSSINANQLLVLTDQGDVAILKLGDELLLDKIYQVSKNTSKFMVDEEKVWFANDTEIKSIPLDEVLSNTTDKQISSRCASPMKTKRKRPIISFEKLGMHKLIYLTDQEEIMVFDCVSDETKMVIKSLSDKIAGFKRVSNGSLCVWSKNGSVTELQGSEKVKLVDVKLPFNELIKNELVSIDVSHDGDVFAGDKFGNLTIYYGDTIMQSLKAHDSTITGIQVVEVFDRSFVVSIGRDRMIQVFIKRDACWELFQTLSIHKGTLTDVLYHDKRLFVCSSDRTISIHRFERTKIEASDELADELEAKLNLDETSVQDTITVYQEKIISERSAPVSMQISNDELIVSTADKSLTAYKLGPKSVEKLKNVKLYNELGDSLLVENFTMDNGVIFVSSSDKSLRCFQFSNGKQLSCNWGHSEVISGIVHLPETESLITVGNDGCMFTWDYSFDPVTSHSGGDITPEITTQKVARKILPTTPLGPSRQNSSMRSLSPTTRLIRKPAASPVPMAISGHDRSPTRSSSPMLRSTTLNRLSQPKASARSPLKETNYVVAAARPGNAEDVVKFLANLRGKLENDKSAYTTKDLTAIKSEVQKLFYVLGGDEETRLLENYSDRLLQLLEAKMHK